MQEMGRYVPPRRWNHHPKIRELLKYFTPYFEGHLAKKVQNLGKRPKIWKKIGVGKNIEVIFRYSWNFGENMGLFLGTIGENRGLFLGTFGENRGLFLGTFGENRGLFLGTFGKNRGLFLGSFAPKPTLSGGTYPYTLYIEETPQGIYWWILVL